jgi:flagellar basal body rod protein FlgC
MDPISSAGLAGMLYGFTKVEQSSARVVEAFSTSSAEDGVQALADLKAAERQVQASATVIKTAQEIQDATLDIIA